MRAVFGVLLSLLALSIATVFQSAMGQRGDAPKYRVVGPSFYGVFNHYHFPLPTSDSPPTEAQLLACPDTCPVWYALVPTDRPHNGAAIIHLDSGGLVSHSTDPNDPTGALRLLEDRSSAALSRGYTVFTVTHGRGPPATGYNPSLWTPTASPGFLATEVAEQIHRAIRHIKAVIPGHPELGHVNTDHLIATGGSSGGALALQLLVNGSSAGRHGGVPGGHSPFYRFDASIDGYSSQVAAASVTAPGGDFSNYRGQGDPAYVFKYPAMFVYPDLSGLGFSSQFPAPMSATVAQMLWKTTGSSWVPRFSFAPELNWFFDSTPEMRPLHFPGGRWRRIAWDRKPYPDMNCQVLQSELDSLSLPLNVTAMTGPALLVHGEEDGNLNVHQSLSYAQAATAVGAAVELFTYPSVRHSWRDVDLESNQAMLCFADRVFFGLQPKGDADGDGQSDCAEAQIGNRDSDSSEAFRIDSVSWAPSSFVSRSLDALTMRIEFKKGSNSAGGVFLLEQASDLSSPRTAWVPATSAVHVPLSSDRGRFDVCFSQPTSIVASEAVFYRVTHRPATGPSCASTAPVGRMAHVVQRKEIRRLPFGAVSALPSYTNLIGASLHVPDLYRGLATCREAATTRSFDFSVGTLSSPFRQPSGALLNLGPSASGSVRYVAMIANDRSRSIPATNPEDRRAEGYWWPVISNTANTVTVARHDGLKSVPLEDASDHDVVIRSTSSLEDILGPAGVWGIPLHNGLRSGDRIRILKRDGSTATALSVSSGINGYILTKGPGLIPVNPADIRLLPDEVFALDVAWNGTEPTTYITSFGCVPTSDIVAYLSGPGPDEPGRRSNIRSWPFPHSAPLWGVQRSSNLLESGFHSDPVLPAAGDRLIFADKTSTSIGWMGDVHGIPATGHYVDDTLFRNTRGQWSSPYPLFGTATPLMFGDVTHRLMRPAQGYDIQLSLDKHLPVFGFQRNVLVSRIMVWNRRRPYPRP